MYPIIELHKQRIGKLTDIGPGLLCQHNFEHNGWLKGLLKALSIMPGYNGKD